MLQKYPARAEFVQRLIVCGISIPERKLNFDVLRAFAAFCVVYIHVDFDLSHFSDADLYLKILLRLCVPVFVLMSCYFLKGETVSEAVTWTRIWRVARITIAANLIYLILCFFHNQATDIVDFLIRGDWVHLWFMSSLLFGLLFIRFYFRYVKRILLCAVISVAIMLACHVCDFSASRDNAGTPRLLVELRFLQSLPLIWCGFLLRRSAVKPFVGSSAALGLVVVGIILRLAEAWYLSSIGAGDVNPQFPLGVLPMTFGIMWFCEGMRGTFGRAIAWIGARYSLLIYLLHPIILTLLKHFAPHLHLSQDGLLLLSLTVAPVVAFALPAGPERVAPWFNRFLSGNWGGGFANSRLKHSGR